MKKALIGKGKYCFVYGSLPPPDRFDPTYDAWERCNDIVHSWIINSVSPSIAESVMFMESAADVWKDLRSHFSQGNRVRIAELQHQLYNLKQGGLSVTDFFTQLKIMWEELENYRPIPLCTCAVRCTCDSNRNARVFRGGNYVMRFLMGLNENYSMVKSQILMMNPFPDLNFAFSTVLQFERQNGLNPSSEEEQVMINAVEGKHFGNFAGKKKNPNSNKICTHCGKDGHTVEVCYKKHGYPQHYKFKNGKL